MAFDPAIKEAIEGYVRAHLGHESWHLSYFDFIDDQDLSKRLGEEFLSTRYIYKMLGGLEVQGWLLRAQIRGQVISYASIYEAAIHHLLFNNMSSRDEVRALTEFPMKKVISIPADKLVLLGEHLEHDGKKIIPTYDGIGKTDELKVRFDRKAKCACKIGIIEEWLMDDLIEFYEARNSIHIHAEIRKSLAYEIDLSMRCYRRMQPFKEQVVMWQNTAADQPS